MSSVHFIFPHLSQLFSVLILSDWMFDVSLFLISEVQTTISFDPNEALIFQTVMIELLIP